MIKQDSINRAWVAMAKAADLIAEDVRSAAERAKDKNYSESCEMESAAAKLKKTSEKMKTDYPHLFTDAP